MKYRPIRRTLSPSYGELFSLVEGCCYQTFCEKWPPRFPGVADSESHRSNDCPERCGEHRRSPVRRKGRPRQGTPPNNQMQGTPQPYLPSTMTVRRVPSTDVKSCLKGRP